MRSTPNELQFLMINSRHLFMDFFCKLKSFFLCSLSPKKKHALRNLKNFSPVKLKSKRVATPFIKSASRILREKLQRLSTSIKTDATWSATILENSLIPSVIYIFQMLAIVRRYRLKKKWKLDCAKCYPSLKRSSYCAFLQLFIISKIHRAIPIAHAICNIRSSDKHAQKDILRCYF